MRLLLGSLWFWFLVDSAALVLLVAVLLSARPPQAFCAQQFAALQPLVPGFDSLAPTPPRSAPAPACIRLLFGD